MHATIPKVDMGHDQYTVPDTVAVELTFVAFPVNSKQTTIPLGIAACAFSDNLSRQ